MASQCRIELPKVNEADLEFYEVGKKDNYDYFYRTFMKLHAVQEATMTMMILILMVIMMMMVMIMILAHDWRPLHGGKQAHRDITLKVIVI